MTSSKKPQKKEIQIGSLGLGMLYQKRRGLKNEAVDLVQYCISNAYGGVV
jgi:hypothetical protein